MHFETGLLRGLQLRIHDVDEEVFAVDQVLAGFEFGEVVLFDVFDGRQIVFVAVEVHGARS